MLSYKYSNSLYENKTDFHPWKDGLYYESGLSSYTGTVMQSCDVNSVDLFCLPYKTNKFANDIHKYNIKSGAVFPTS